MGKNRRRSTRKNGDEDFGKQLSLKIGLLANKNNNMEEEAKFIKTCFGQDSGDAVFRYKNKDYSVQFNPTTGRVPEPVNFDYVKRITQAIGDFEKSGRHSMNFWSYASLESIKKENGVAMATFIMPGTLNQVFKIPLDLSKQDMEGRIGLKIRCVIKHVK